MAKRKTKEARRIEALTKELARRAAKVFSAVAVAGDHVHQLAYLLCVAQFAVCLCSRRAGKSLANMVLLALTAMGANNVTCLYIGLTEKAVKLDTVRQIWNPLVRAYGLPFTEVNADGVATCTTTGSIVRFASVDDSAHIEAFRGGDYAGGIVIVDECQSIHTATLKALVKNIIIPALSSTTAEHPTPGKLRLTGTVPETPHGGFYHYYKNALDADVAGPDPDDFVRFSWNRFQNPYLTDQEPALQKKLALLKLTIDAPEIRRDDFGELVYDANANAYRFAPGARNTYSPTLQRLDLGPFHCTFAPALGLDRFACGIDPAQRKDRFAFVVWGWNSAKKDVLYQVGECVTDLGADPMETEWLEITKEIKRRFGSVRFIKDPGSTAAVNDVLYEAHGIVIEVAVKGPGSIKMRVDRLADLLNRGVAKVFADGMLCADLQAAQWSAKKREEGKWEFDKSTNGSPDIADAGSYAIPLFIAANPKPPKVATSIDAYWAEENAKEIARLWRQAAEPAYKPKKSIAESLWKGAPR